MLRKLCSTFILLGLSSLSAQSFIPKVSTSLIQSKLSKEIATSVNILAVMADFQPDDFDLTYGDGTFGSIYSEDYGNEIIDPLPHDENYFKDHLDFATNYYSKVSNGNFEINYTILPNVVTVSKVMREYSPIAGESFKLLGDFSQEVWNLVDNQNSDIDFSQYDVFLIFHAGVGKDISTSDLFGEARDLPSIYLGLNTLKEIYGDSFNGFQLNSGALIPNSIILPETESREESGFGEVVLIELSINGLIVSSIASHLGLPDLFDAETGKSAIGRFGLMDGQSLFAFAGLFPPEPSAWEKIFLGWEVPTVIDANTNNILVTASEIAQSSEAKIIKVPINSTEYYLIENRNRDANNDGVTITYKVAGQVRTINFTEDLDNFNNAFVDTLKGVVLDVDEFDWAIPGSGILIWHIDEKIIDEGLIANRVNVGKNRGVDLEEADGIQDIGEEFQTIFGDIIIAEGDEFDFWYSSNSSELYKNEFGIGTKPSTLTNNGANSLITFSNFSDISNQMSFDIRFGNNTITPIQNFNVDPNLGVTNHKTLANTDQNASYFLSGSNLYKVGDTVHQLNDFSNNNYVVVEGADEETIIGGFNNQLNIANYTNNAFTNVSIETPANISSPLVVNLNSSSEAVIYAGLANGNINKYLYNLSDENSVPIIESTLNMFSNSIKQVAVFENEIAAISENEIKILDGNEYSFSSNIKKIILTKNRENQLQAIIMTVDHSIYSVVNGSDTQELIFYSTSQVKDFALADLKNDGGNYVIFYQVNRINALNLSGASADKFPYELNSGEGFVGTPLVADINDDGNSDIISATNDGNIYAFSGKNGNIIAGFPISVGGSFEGVQTIVKRENDLLLSAITADNEFYLWSINSSGNVSWGSEFGNNLNSSSIKKADDQNFISSYFPKNRTYNWPNPVYGNETFIRTYVAEDSQVKLRIFDLSGDLVDEFEYFASGGIDSEFAWEVSDIQSGAYFASIEVKSVSGKTESKIIKIAVVK